MIGLTASLAMTLFFLELKSYESGPGDLGKMSYDDDDEIAIITNRTPPPPPPPPPPAPPEVIQIVEDDLEIEEVEFESTETDESDIIEIVEIVEKKMRSLILRLLRTSLSIQVAKKWPLKMRSSCVSTKTS